MKSPEMEMGTPKTSKEELKIKAALKSGQAIEKGYDDAFFMDNEHLLKDREIMALVAQQYPYILGHLNKLNKDHNFVIQWLKYVNPSQVVEVYENARLNSLRISLSQEELSLIANKK